MRTRFMALILQFLQSVKSLIFSMTTKSARAADSVDRGLPLVALALVI